MNNGVKIALIVSAAILLATGAVIYFSPYQTCVREMKATAQPGTLGSEVGSAELFCARNSK
ncbi:hypothetical protein BH10PSE14_BH10PSE14_07620 [soil metagenome]